MASLNVEFHFSQRIVHDVAVLNSAMAAVRVALDSSEEEEFVLKHLLE